MTVTESVFATDEQRVDDLVNELLNSYPPKTTDPVTFLGAQFDAGLGWVHFPVGHGGLGLNPKLQKLVNERVFAEGAPHSGARNPIGHGMCGPTVAVWGTEEQKQRYLRPLFTGEEIWCQLFSEPGAGSDFADRREGRRRMDLQRPEGVDDPGPCVQMGSACRADRS